MSYTVLARRYRSRDFDEIVGQEAVSRTLRNAIEHGRTAHAYLFCGTRGVGKTSMARIFAKALNVSPDLAQADQIGEAILRGDDLDVIEIDGASNRGINEARDLIAGAGLSPTRCPFKIYIIDEVHMLTREAFNALLKTMEEPPAHVKFILCTTEPQKVPATIQSRCQRFDFRALATSQIVEQIRHVLAGEGVEADDDAVAQIARLGNGSMRDALSLLDRVLAAGETRVTTALLEQMLGLPDQTIVTGLVDALLDGDPAAALARGGELLARGATVEQALEQIVGRLHVLMLVRAGDGDGSLVELPAEALEAAREQAASLDVPALVHMIALCDAAARNARGSAVARALFDAVLVRLCLSERFADIAALLDGAPPPAPRAAAPAAKKKAVAPPPRPPADPAPAPDPTAPDRVAEIKPDAAPPAPSPGAALEPGAGPDALWALVEARAAGHPALQAKIEALVPVALEGDVLRLAVRGSGGYVRTQSASIERLVRDVAGRPVRVELEPDDDGAGAPADDGAPTSTAAAAEAARLPLVERAMELFDASIMNVRDDG